MKKVFFSLLIMSCFAFNEGDTKIQTYNYGHNGMEFVARSGEGTIGKVALITSNMKESGLFCRDNEASY